MADVLADLFVKLPLLLLMLLAAVADGLTLGAIQNGRLAAETTGLRHRSDCPPARHTILNVGYHVWFVLNRAEALS